MMSRLKRKNNKWAFYFHDDDNSRFQVDMPLFYVIKVIKTFYVQDEKCFEVRRFLVHAA